MITRSGIPSLTLALVALVLASALLAGCRGDPRASDDDVPVRVHVATAPTPPIVGPVRTVLTLTDDDGEPVDDARVRIEGTMTHAGMTPVHDSAVHQGSGRYVVSDFEFTMSGDWILIIRITLPDGREAVREHPLRVVGPDGG